MKLWNSIIIFDHYVIAESPEEARAAHLELVRTQDNPIDPSEQTAREVTNEREVRASQRAAKPFVGPLVSDEDFEKRVKGKTVLEMFLQLYTKQAKK